MIPSTEEGRPTTNPDSRHLRTVPRLRIHLVRDSRTATGRDLPVVLAASFLPGILAGTLVAGLLFFLNPQLPFSFFTLARAALFYGGLLGTVSMALFLPWTWRGDYLAISSLPWTFTVVLSAIATLGWTHASLYSYLLPPGINFRLIGASVWLSVAALFFFYTSLLHTLHNRPYGLRSKIGMTLVVLAALYTTTERRAAFHPRPTPSPRPAIVEVAQPPMLIVVGIDQASLDVILPLAEQGRLPFLSNLIHDGARGRLETFSPVRKAPQWTTLITGKLPFKHGILDDRTYSGRAFGRDARLHLVFNGVGFRAWGTPTERSRRVTATDRLAPALWEILPGLQLPTGMIGWPVSDPVGHRTLFSFSDRFFGHSASPESAQPSELAERGLLFRLRPRELPPGLEESFGGSPPQSLKEALVGDLWRQSLASFLLDQESDLRALFVHLPGQAEVAQRYFGGFSAVEFDGVQGDRNLAAEQSTAAYYSVLDDFLQELWTHTTPPRLLAVVSPYGVEAAGGLRQLWYTLLRRQVVEGTSSGAPDGTFLLLGEGVAPGVFLPSARPIDVVPTLLYGLGLPVARDLDGRVLTEAFEQGFLAAHPLMFVPSYDTLEPSSLRAATSGAGP